MKSNYKIILVICLIISSIFSGCEDDKSTGPPPEDKYVTIGPPPQEEVERTNRIRAKIGIRQIKSDWVGKRRKDGAERWKDSKGRNCKGVGFDEKYEKIIAESDTYYTGRAFPCLDPDGGISEERLIISYSYGPKLFTLMISTEDPFFLDKWLKPWDVTSTTEYCAGGHYGKSNEETLKIADEILDMWGLKRFE